MLIPHWVSEQVYEVDHHTALRHVYRHINSIAKLKCQVPRWNKPMIRGKCLRDASCNIGATEHSNGTVLTEGGTLDSRRQKHSPTLTRSQHIHKFGCWSVVHSQTGKKVRDSWISNHCRSSGERSLHHFKYHTHYIFSNTAHQTNASLIFKGLTQTD